MTHSGGKPHAVGDRGQRYEITVYDETQKTRIVFGWSESEKGAHEMGAAAVLRPSWKDYEVRDRASQTCHCGQVNWKHEANAVTLAVFDSMGRTHRLTKECDR